MLCKKVCVDDFALRKKFTYGTVMVNLESHRIIDMIILGYSGDLLYLYSHKRVYLQYKGNYM